ncbi:MAG: hypothetical protein FWG98_15145, partial [Candidatus Cloacimonetes bacterium]|nr:hypothetical protein [Candidatus Cloacimonadota bacterium]
FKSYKIKQFVFYTILVGLCFWLATCKSPTKPPEKDDGWKRIDLGARIFPGAISSDRFYVAYENGVAIFEDMTKPPDLDIKLDIYYPVFILPIFPRITDKMIAYHGRRRLRNLLISEFSSKNIIFVGTSDFGEHYGTEYDILGVIQAIEIDPINKIHRFYAIMTKIVEEGAPLFIVYFDIQIDNENNMKLIDKGFWEFLSGNIYAGFTNNSIRYKNMVLYSHFSTISVVTSMAIIYDDLSFKILDNFQVTNKASFWIWKDILYARLTTGDIRFTKDGENWTDFGNFEMGITNGNEIDDYLFFSRIIYGKDYIYFFEKEDKEMCLYQLSAEFGEKINSINKYQEYLVITTDRAIYYHLFEDLLNTKTFIRKYNFIGE